ncbi:MAG: serine hydrolase [Bacteroidales bacterium]|nr:serine hydrolase [Bacteroidales bacterium]
MNFYKISPVFLTLSFFLLFSFATPVESEFLENFQGSSFDPPIDYSTPWVDSVFYSLTPEQRLAQLFIIEVQSNQNRRYYDRISKLLSEYNIGGVIFFRGGPVSQLRLTNTLQRQMQTPMFVSIDAEWGLAMRLDSTISFPRQITLGAITNERLIYELGLEMGWQSRRMGIHMNFSPVVDVNSDPRNPVINSRSFGECRYNVSRKGIAMMYGMNDAGIIASAKHFPGHGDTDLDSHYTLPVLHHSREEMDSVHLFPFQKLIEQGLLSVMVAHLNIPELDNTPGIPSSLSRPMVTEILQGEMGFKGLVVTDALNMKGVSDYYPSGELEVRALLAGNDILLMPNDVPKAINSIKKAVENGIIEQDYIDQKVRKVLYFKELAGLDKYRPLPIRDLHSDLNSERFHKINRRLAEAAITIIHNENDLLPLKRLDTLNIAALSIGSSTENPFQSMLANYGPMNMFSISKNHTSQQAENMIRQLSDYNLIILSVQNNSMFPGRNYGISQANIDLINKLSAENNVVLNIFANPYSLQAFGDGLNNAKAVVISYQDGKDFEHASAQVIFGAIPARGRLPVSVMPHFPIYTGIMTQGGLRARYLNPDDVGINPEMLKRVDSIALHGIHEKAFPGCQIAILKDGAMIYNHSFGYHTYENKIPVKNTDIYDLASLTKIIATTATLMKLADEEKINIDDPLDVYLPMVRGTNKENLIIREIMAHQARLRSWIPFFIATLNEGRPDPAIFQSRNSKDFPVKVAENLYIHKDYRDTIFRKLLDSELLSRRRYIYSDLGFILFAEMIESVTGLSIDNYVNQTFFKPLGLKTMTYNPLEKFSTDRIIPTENDTLFRGQTLKGYVHDPTAAMLGGVAGHAGLFSNAADVAVFMQMLLQNGSYGGIEFISPETVREFTTTQYAGNQNRRALGFDKPSIRALDSSPAAKSASFQSYGHTGFTGIYAWVDPKENLVYVFLSNRVHPDASNRKISEMSIRLEIHQAIYDAVFSERLIFNTRLP